MTSQTTYADLMLWAIEDSDGRLTQFWWALRQAQHNTSIGDPMMAGSYVELAIAEAKVLASR